MAQRRSDVPEFRRLAIRRPKNGMARPAPAWVFVLVPVVSVAAVLGLAVLVRGGIGESSHRTERRPVSAPSRADTAVRTYLRALARGDAATAITVSSPRPTGRFLTRSVLTAQQRAAPLHNIVVSSRGGSGSRDDVDVQYWFGRRHVRTRMAVVKSHGQWRVQYGTVAIDVRYEGKVPGLLVWGRPITEDVIHVFPGPVRFTSSDPDLGVIDKDAADFPVEPTTGGGAPDLDVRLSSTGRARAIEAALALLRSCAAAERLEPGGCPQRAYDYEALGSGVSWQLVGDPARDLDADFDGPTYRTVRVSGDVRWTVDYAARRFGGALDRKHADITSFVDGTFDLASGGFSLD